MIEDVLGLVVGLRTRIIYDSRGAMFYLLFKEFLPFFRKKGLEITFIIHSEHASRKLEILSKYYDVFEDVKVVKVGYRSEVPVGKLVEYVPMNKCMFKKLAEILENFDEKDAVVLWGFYTVLFYYDAPVSMILHLFDCIQKDVTVVMPQPIGVFDRRIDAIIGKVFDLDFIVKKVENEYFSEVYYVRVEQSLIPDLNFYAKLELNGTEPKWSRTV